MKKNEKVTAVVITYNRLAFLKELISALKNQTRKPDKIIVVNNSSTDGTEEWLKQQDFLEVITQENCGSSGGQHTGIKAAFQSGSNWIWTMDDDVEPRPDCLEKLLAAEGNWDVRVPLRIAHNGKPYLNDVIKLNIENPFTSFWAKIIDEDSIKKDILPIEGPTFEGPLFRNEIVGKIGLPDKKNFIFGDDTEFFLRALKAGYRFAMINSAKFDRKLPAPKASDGFSWKNYYIIRNGIALDVIHGNLAVRLIRPFFRLFNWLRKAQNAEEKKTCLKAFADGYFYKPEYK